MFFNKKLRIDTWNEDFPRGDLLDNALGNPIEGSEGSGIGYKENSNSDHLLESSTHPRGDMELKWPFRVIPSLSRGPSLCILHQLIIVCGLLLGKGNTSGEVVPLIKGILTKRWCVFWQQQALQTACGNEFLSPRRRLCASPTTVNLINCIIWKYHQKRTPAFL